MSKLEDARREREDHIAELKACNCMWPLERYRNQHGHKKGCPAIALWEARKARKHNRPTAVVVEDTGPKLVSGPKYKEIDCSSCGATISYLPEHVETYSGTDYGGGPDGYSRVKCPRDNCKGYGTIRSW